MYLAPKAFTAMQRSLKPKNMVQVHIGALAVSVYSVKRGALSRNSAHREEYRFESYGNCYKV